MSQSSQPVESLLDRAVTDWLVAHDRGLTPAEARGFEAWLERSPDHARAWEHASTLWGAFDRESDPAVDRMLAAARMARASSWSRVPLRFAAGFAVLALVLGSGLFDWRQTGVRTNNVQQVAQATAPQVFSAGTGLGHVTLPDGSNVVLDAQSAIQVRQSAQRRDLTLIRGRAFFDVAHDPGRPFVVMAANRTVTDVGTAFVVSLQPAGLSVVLERGRVRIAHADHAANGIDLDPGRQYEEADGQPAVVTAVDVEATLAWKNGLIELNDTPISDAVAQINRYAKQPLYVGDAKAAALKVTGQYRLDDANGFAESLAAIYPVSVRHRADGASEIVSR
jgi:transmembrane sensor